PNPPIVRHFGNNSKLEVKQKAPVLIKDPETGLLTDVDSVRHATLQNRAAIDFLLLAHGHGCEDFEGLCCMNLSDNSLSIHANIQALRDSVAKLKRLIDKSTKRILMVEQKGGDVRIQLESCAGSTAQLMTEMDMLAYVGRKPWQPKAQKQKKKLARQIALEIDKYSTNEKLASAKPISHKTKNLGRLRPDTPRNTVSAHAPKTKLKSSDAKKTLEAFIKDLQ
ncbi:hypothetical protein HGM15179_020701, partial [Zosterops borbonicus]